MKSIVVLIVMGIGIGSAGAQIAPTFTRTPVRLLVRHADPWAIKAMLEGQKIVSPEMSTILGFMGLPASTGQAINGFFTDGKLVVNPTDNSIWFYPDKPTG